MSGSGILSGIGLSATNGSSSSGTVTSVSVVTANGLSGTVATATTTPAITLTASGLSPSVITGTAAVLTANTFTATQTVTEAVGSSALVLTGATQTSSLPVINATQTWNNAATAFTGILLNVTNTASAAGSVLQDWQVSGVSKVSITKAGAIASASTITGNGLVAASGSFITTNGNALYFNGTGSGSGPALLQNSATQLLLLNGSQSQFVDFACRGLTLLPTTQAGQLLAILNLSELTTIAAAASTDTAIQMPAGAIVMAVSVRVTTTIPTATTFTVGDSGLATRFSTASVGVASGSTDAGTAAGAYYNAGALSVRLTMVGAPPAANTGRVRVTIWYFLSTPPTS